MLNGAHMKFLKINYNLKVLLFSCLIALYFITFAVPFVDNHGFFIKNYPPQSNLIMPYFLLTVPLFIIYIWFLFVNFRKIAFLKSLNYSIMIVNIFFGIFICLLIFGGGVLWIETMSFPFLLC